MKQIVTHTDIIPPGKSLHHVFKIESHAPLEVTVVDRHDIEAEAVLDSEGWCIIILTNVVGVPVNISLDEPIREGKGREGKGDRHFFIVDSAGRRFSYSHKAVLVRTHPNRME